MKNKKAQGRLGKTLTWFVGFIIIVFVMIILTVASTVLTGSKRISGGWDEIELQNYKVYDLDMQRVLIGLLNGKSELNGEELSVRDLFIKFESNESDKSIIRDRIREEVYNGFSGLEGCYVLVVGDNQDNQNKEDIIRFSNLKKKFEDNSKSFIETEENYFLRKGIVFPLISEDKDIKLKFYYGKC